MQNINQRHDCSSVCDQYSLTCNTPAAAELSFGWTYLRAYATYCKIKKDKVTSTILYNPVSLGLNPLKALVQTSHWGGGGGGGESPLNELWSSCDHGNLPTWHSKAADYSAVKNLGLCKRSFQNRGWKSTFCIDF